MSEIHPSFLDRAEEWERLRNRPSPFDNPGIAAELERIKFRKRAISIERNFVDARQRAFRAGMAARTDAGDQASGEALLALIGEWDAWLRDEDSRLTDENNAIVEAHYRGLEEATA